MTADQKQEAKGWLAFGLALVGFGWCVGSTVGAAYGALRLLGEYVSGAEERV